MKRHKSIRKANFTSDFVLCFLSLMNDVMLKKYGFILFRFVFGNHVFVSCVEFRKIGCNEYQGHAQMMKDALCGKYKETSKN